MRTIWKYPMPLEAFSNAELSTVLSLREGYVILDIQMQNGEPTMWVELDPQAPVETCEIAIAGTGSVIPREPHEYLRTVQDGGLVWHFYVLEDG